MVLGSSCGRRVQLGRPNLIVVRMETLQMCMYYCRGFWTVRKRQMFVTRRIKAMRFCLDGVGYLLSWEDTSCCCGLQLNIWECSARILTGILLYYMRMLQDLNWFVSWKKGNYMITTDWSISGTIEQADWYITTFFVTYLCFLCWVFYLGAY